MKRLSGILVTVFALLFAFSVTACTDSLVGPEEEQIEEATPVHFFNSRHNFTPANSDGEGGSMDRRGSHNHAPDEDPVE